jgi:hypothetical protein
MKNILKTIMLILFVGFAACDDFIEVDPIGPDADDYFNSEAEYESALIGAYDLLQASFWNVLTGVVASDDYAAGGDTFTEDQPTLQNVNRMTHSPADENQLRDIWNLMYAGINRTNYLLEFKNKTEFDGKDEIIAQAYFLRAYYTFELVKFFGNVPLKVQERDGVNRIADSRVVIGEQFNINRTENISEAYSLIEEDLKEAILNLPVTQDEVYKVTLGAAQALLGKVYLYHGTYDSAKFADAATMLNNVIGTQYSLTTGTDYLDLFESSMENSSESVFEIQYTGVEGAGWDCITCSEGSYFVQFCGPRSPYDNPVYRTGWGFCLPSQELYDMFDDGDSRREVTFYDLRDEQDSYSPGRDDTGFFNKKYMPRKADERVGANPLNHANNYRSIRYADVLLMAAEAEVKSVGVNAIDYLNQVRARAYGDNSHDYMASEGDLLEAIYTERRKELAGEGHRFFDLVRTGKAMEAFDAYNAIRPADAAINFTIDKNELFPIPLIELELANAVTRWGQNQGY